jgi:hypothetical protein
MYIGSNILDRTHVLGLKYWSECMNIALYIGQDILQSPGNWTEYIYRV